MSGTAVVVFAAIVAPVAILGPNALVQNTIEFPLGLASIKSEAVSPLPGRLLVETGQAGRFIAVALLALACLGIVAWLVFWPPRTVPAAAWRIIIGLSLMFVLAPATRFGYFLYPAGLLAWLGISWLGSSGAGPPGSARSAKASTQPAYQSANHGSSAASGTMYSTVCA
jgi:CBS domain containing-hemolysin-like protein